MYVNAPWWSRITCGKTMSQTTMLFSDMQEKNCWYIFHYRLSISIPSFLISICKLTILEDVSVCLQQLLSTLASKPPLWHTNRLALQFYCKYTGLAWSQQRLKVGHSFSGKMRNNKTIRNKQTKIISPFCHNLNYLHHIWMLTYSSNKWAIRTQIQMESLTAKRS